MNRYNNYHKHDHMSSIFTPDSNAHIEDYAKRAIELNHDSIFTTNHGCGGDIFEAKSISDKYNLGCKFGIEGYIVKDNNPQLKDARNYHIIIIPRTNVARKKINLLSSNANEFGYYYKPRLSLQELINNFEPNEIYITTACVAGIIRDDDGINDIFLPLYEKFGKSLFLEVQPHTQDIQKSLNEKALKLSNEYGLRLIGANDSHYIYTEQAKERLLLLEGKGIKFSDEDSFVLDYPDYKTMCQRFQRQGIFTNSQIVDLVDQTLVFDECEDIYISKEIKMPTIYPNLSNEQKMAKLKESLNTKFKSAMIRNQVAKEDIPKYVSEVKRELEVISETAEVHSVDYFLFNEKNTDLALQYGGVLTRSGRGSGGAFIINNILGITQIDRLSTNLPLYSERFMSTARLLENKALPDIDFNVVEQKPFVDASRTLLGYHGCYPMVAYGTMQLSESFRNVCRANELDHKQYNEIGKNIDSYYNDDEWGKYIKEAEKYVDTIISISPHPCAHLLLNGDIREEVGTIRIGNTMCALITSLEADEWKYLKNDYLVVTVWDIINKVFNLINKPIMSVKELLSQIDNKVWDLFSQGLTATLNQVDGDWATNMIKIYKPQTMEELAKFVACIRPSFNSFRDDFINRRPYSTGSLALDELLNSTDHFVLFQENLMQYFEWLGITPSESIGIIKKISKKKIKQSDFDSLTERLRSGWLNKVGKLDGFDEVWTNMQSMMNYGFNSPHGVAYAIDCLYCAYLKANYPLEYYTVVLDIYQGNEEKTNRLAAEMRHFGISLKECKFRMSSGHYAINPTEKAIYKGIGSIKNLNAIVGEELYSLKDQKYSTFIDLLFDLKTQPINSRQLDILIKIGFFEEFGKAKALLRAVEVFEKFYKCKTISIEKSLKEGWDIDLIKPHCGKFTKKTLSQLDNKAIILSLLKAERMPKTTIVDRIKWQLELLGDTTLSDTKVSACVYVCTKITTTTYGTKYATLYNICYGVPIECRVNKRYANKYLLEEGIVYECAFQELDKRTKNADGEWICTGEKINELKAWAKVED